MATLNNLPARIDIVTSKGDLSYIITCTKNSLPFSLVGYTFAATLRYKGATSALTVTNTDLAGGVITVSITDAIMEAAGFGIHLWDLDWTVGGLVRTAFAGTWEIRQKD